MNSTENIFDEPLMNHIDLNEDVLIKALENFDPANEFADLDRLLKGLAEVGTMKALQHLERLDNKNRFNDDELKFTKAIIAARHNRPYRIQLAETLYNYEIKGLSNVTIKKAETVYLSNIIEHHLNTSYGFKLSQHNGYVLSTEGKEYLILLGNGKENNLYNALLDRKGIHGLVYQHCEIRLKWCLLGFVFSEPENGNIAFNVFSTSGQLLYKGFGKNSENKLIINGINYPDNSRIHSCFEAVVMKNELILISAVNNRPLQIKRKTVPLEH